MLKAINTLIGKIGVKDTTPVERLELNQVRSTIEAYCEKYLHDTDDILRFEALPSAINYVIEVLDLEAFQDKYESAQVSETLFDIRLREFEL